MLLGFSFQFGSLALAVLIAGESAGVSLLGETALVAASALAAKGRLSFPIVVLTAALAAIVGDNFGYLVGRLGGYRLLSGRGPFQVHRSRLLARGDAFFAQHGAIAVFLGRWTPLLRVTAAVLAGTHHMKWRHFLVWNTLGGVGWVLTIGGCAHLLGGQVPGALAGIGIATGILWAGGLAGRLAYKRLRHASDVSMGAPDLGDADDAGHAARLTRFIGENSPDGPVQ
jgi:membrane protein DedA with SNARE-associated domain